MDTPLRTHLVAAGCLLALFAPLPSLAGQAPEKRRPAPSIAGARWEDYRDMYDRSPLCAKEEVTLWRCEAGKMDHALCSTPRLDETTGYIQYRAAEGGHVRFVYPTGKVPPARHFAYRTSANGDAFLDFSEGGSGYSLADPLRGPSEVSTSAATRRTTVECENANQSLQINYTMRLMYDAGLWDGH